MLIRSTIHLPYTVILSPVTLGCNLSVIFSDNLNSSQPIESCFYYLRDSRRIRNTIERSTACRPNIATSPRFNTVVCNPLFAIIIYLWNATSFKCCCSYSHQNSLTSSRVTYSEILVFAQNWERIHYKIISSTHKIQNFLVFLLIFSRFYPANKWDWAYFDPMWTRTILYLANLSPILRSD